MQYPFELDDCGWTDFNCKSAAMREYANCLRRCTGRRWWGRRCPV